MPRHRARSSVHSLMRERSSREVKKVHEATRLLSELHGAQSDGPLVGEGTPDPNDDESGAIETYKYVWYEPAEAIRSLKKHPKGVNTVNDIGWTTLMWAALEGEAEIFFALLEAGADPCIESTAEWHPAGREHPYFTGANALDLCEIAMSDGVSQTDEGEEDSHLAIYRRLLQIFKVAEVQAVRPVSTWNEITQEYDHTRLPLAAYSTVVHVVDACYRDRPYSATFRSDKLGLQFGVSDGRVAITHIDAGGEADQIAAREYAAILSKGYCHPRPPAMANGLVVKSINGHDVSTYSDVDMVTLMAEGYSIEDADAALAEATKIINRDLQAGEAAPGQAPAQATVELSTLEFLQLPSFDEIQSLFGGSAAEHNPKLEELERQKRTKTFEYAQSWLRTNGKVPTRPTKVDFIEPKTSVLKGWVEGSDALRAVDSATGDPELYVRFASLDPSLADESNPKGTKRFYAAGNCLSSAVTMIREKKDPAREWIAGNISDSPNYVAADGSTGPPPTLDTISHAESNQPPVQLVPTPASPKHCTTLYYEGNDDEITTAQFLELMGDGSGTVNNKTLVYSDDDMFLAAYTDWTPWGQCSSLFGVTSFLESGESATQQAERQLDEHLTKTAMSVPPGGSPKVLASS